jgi:uncharacterized protein YdeI (YjbR/CyaY-like superfamily)
MPGIQWIKRGGRHRDVRKREEERVADEQIEEALEPAPRKRRPRTVEVPPDLARALRRAPAARTAFDGLSYTHRKDYATWVAEAKRPETRARRVEETIRQLAAGRKWKDR